MPCIPSTLCRCFLKRQACSLNATHKREKIDSQYQRLSVTGPGIDGKHLVSSQITATDGRAEATALLAATLHG